MSRSLALCLCVAAVLILLAWDRRQSRTLSVATWIPTIWMLLVASKPLAVWFGLGDEGGDGAGSWLDRWVFSGMLLLALSVLIGRRTDWSRINPWVVVLLSYAFISIAWSDIPFVSFKRWTRDLLAVVMILLVLSESDPRQAVQAILRRVVYVLVPSSLLLIKYFPELGVEYGFWDGQLMWVGVTDQKNGLGRLCLIAIVFLVWSLVRKWRGRERYSNKPQTLSEILLLVTSFWLLAGGRASTYSATAVVALAGAMVMLTTLQLRGRRPGPFVVRGWHIVLVLAFVYGTILPFAAAGGSAGALLVDTLGRDQTFTGRTDIWAKLLPYVERRPWLGHGYGGFWTSDTQAAALNMKEAHNGYLAACLELGIVGLALTAILFTSLAQKLTRGVLNDADPDWAVLCLALLLILLLHNASEASLNSFDRHLMSTFILLSVITVATYRPRRHVTSPSAKQATGLRRPYRPGLSPKLRALTEAVGAGGSADTRPAAGAASRYARVTSPKAN